MFGISYRPSASFIKLRHSLFCLIKKHSCPFNLALHEVPPLVCHLTSKNVFIGKPCLSQLILWKIHSSSAGTVENRVCDQEGVTKLKRSFILEISIRKNQLGTFSPLEFQIRVKQNQYLTQTTNSNIYIH